MYNIEVTSLITDDSGDKTASFNWKLTVTKHCSNMIITPSSISDLVYIIKDPKQTRSFTSFTPDVISCGSIFYSLSLVNGNPLPSVITLNVLREIELYTLDPSERGNYDVRMNG